MAELTLKDGSIKYVDYNTAAKIHQVMNGNALAVSKDERATITKQAAKVSYIDFKKLTPREPLWSTKSGSK